MKPAEITEVKQEQEIFTDLWNTYKKYYNATTDQEWEQFVNDMDVLFKEKYKDTTHEELFRDILSDIIKQLERRHKNGRNKTN